MTNISPDFEDWYSERRTWYAIKGNLEKERDFYKMLYSKINEQFLIAYGVIERRSSRNPFNEVSEEDRKEFDEAIEQIYKIERKYRNDEKNN